MESSRKVIFGISAPQIHPERSLDPVETQTYIQRAERLGFHSLWVTDPTGLRVATALEGLSLLNYAAALTKTIRLGTAVLAIPIRSAVQMAKALATLDQLSGGRLIVGVGLGAFPRTYPAYGLSAEHRVGRLLEGIALMQMLWTEERVTFNGRFAQLLDASLSPKPLQKPYPPIWFGGSVPAALKRAAKFGTGFICGGSNSTAEFKEQVKVVRSTLETAKRDPENFTIAKRVFVVVDRDRQRAKKKLSEWCAWYYGKPDLADKVGVYGKPNECGEQLAEVVAAGARMVILNPVCEMVNQLHVLAEDIVPLFSRKSLAETGLPADSPGPEMVYPGLNNSSLI